MCSSDLDVVRSFRNYDDAESYAYKLGSGTAKYESYQLPGGKNYREIKLMLPKSQEKIVYPEPLTELPAGYELIHDPQGMPWQKWGILPPGQTHARYYARGSATKEGAIANALEYMNYERNELALKEWRKRNEEKAFK